MNSAIHKLYPVREILCFLVTDQKGNAQHLAGVPVVELKTYAGRLSQKEKEKWGRMVENYLKKSAQLRCVFLLVDIRHEPSANDRQMYEWVTGNGYRPVVVATKLDKIKRSQVAKQVKLVRAGLGIGPDVTVIPFSAETKQGREEIWALIDELAG